jgi:SAM-dependent methyltransferase
MVTGHGPFADRQEEWAFFNPLVGDTMLELGNKKNMGLGGLTYKAFFTALGFRHTSIDLNGQDGALPMDLCRPLGLGTFDMVTNIGTSEHVADQPAVWRNMLDALHSGSVLLCACPLPGDWPGHGQHYPSAEFYRELARLNGLRIEILYVGSIAPRRIVFARMVRVGDQDWIFKMPTIGMVSS